METKLYKPLEYKENVNLGNDRRLLFNLIGKNIPARQREIDENIPLKDTMYGMDTEKVFEILGKEFDLLQKFKIHTIGALKECLSMVKDLEKLAYEIEDETIRTSILEMLDKYKKEILKDIKELDMVLAMQLEKEYEEEITQIMEKHTSLTKTPNPNEITLDTTVKDDDSLDDILDKLMESRDTLTRPPVNTNDGFEL